MDDLAGTWITDIETDAVLNEFDKIDEERLFQQIIYG